MKVTIDGLGTITANRGTLNYIALMAGESAERHLQLGCRALANKELRIRDQISDILDKSGFYKEYTLEK